MNPNENGIPEEGMDMKNILEKMQKLEVNMKIILLN